MAMRFGVWPLVVLCLLHGVGVEATLPRKPKRAADRLPSPSPSDNNNNQGRWPGCTAAGTASQAATPSASNQFGFSSHLPASRTVDNSQWQPFAPNHSNAALPLPATAPHNIIPQTTVSFPPAARNAANHTHSHSHSPYNPPILDPRSFDTPHRHSVSQSMSGCGVSDDSQAGSSPSPQCLNSPSATSNASLDSPLDVTYTPETYASTNIANCNGPSPPRYSSTASVYVPPFHQLSTWQLQGAGGSGFNNQSLSQSAHGLPAASLPPQAALPSAQSNTQARLHVSSFHNSIDASTQPSSSSSSWNLLNSIPTTAIHTLNSAANAPALFQTPMPINSSLNPVTYPLHLSAVNANPQLITANATAQLHSLHAGLQQADPLTITIANPQFPMMTIQSPLNWSQHAISAPVGVTAGGNSNTLFNSFSSIPPTNTPFISFPSISSTALSPDGFHTTASALHPSMTAGPSIIPLNTAHWPSPVNINSLSLPAIPFVAPAVNNNSHNQSISSVAAFIAGLTNTPAPPAAPSITINPLSSSTAAHSVIDPRSALSSNSGSRPSIPPFEATRLDSSPSPYNYSLVENSITEEPPGSQRRATPSPHARSPSSSSSSSPRPDGVYDSVDPYPTANIATNVGPSPNPASYPLRPMDVPLERLTRLDNSGPNPFATDRRKKRSQEKGLNLIEIGHTYSRNGPLINIRVLRYLFHTTAEMLADIIGSRPGFAHIRFYDEETGEWDAYPLLVHSVRGEVMTLRCPSRVPKSVRQACPWWEPDDDELYKLFDDVDSSLHVIYIVIAGYYFEFCLKVHYTR